MRRIIILLLAVTSSIYLQAQWSKEQFEQLYPLTGTWAMTMKSGLLLEVWEKANSHELLSRSFRVKEQDTVPLETVRLYLDGMNIFYTPTVPDQNNAQPVPFKLIELDNNRFVFENRNHDFPQRIIYHLKNNDELEVITDGTTSKGYRKNTFLFVRK